MTKTIAVLATLDTKGQEADYLRERIQAHGCNALLVDIGVVGIIGEPRRDRCGPRQIGSGWLSISARTAHHCDGRVLGASQACGVTWCS